MIERLESAKGEAVGLARRVTGIVSIIIFFAVTSCLIDRLLGLFLR